MTPAGFPHSDTPGSQLGCQLPGAYRRLLRPSSALDAKASTMCPSQLVSQTLNKNCKRTTNFNARVHCSIHKQPTHQDQPPHKRAPAKKAPRTTKPVTRPESSGPNSVPPTIPHQTPAQVPHPHPETGTRVVLSTRPHQERLFIDDSTSEHHHALPDTRWQSGRVLLRKEVIQPHLPVRLPCYDFVPIASPTFDGSLPQGVRPPASGVADFRDVTGGVYKARERIHRSVADLRLLATPTSWGRVADPNPN